MALFGFKKKETEKEPKIMPVFPENIYEAGVLELQDVIAPSALEVNSNFLKLGEKVARTLFIFAYPRYLAVNWFSPIINLDKVFDISIFVHPVAPAAVLRQMQKKVAEVQSQIHMREEKGLVRDPMLDTAHKTLRNCATNSSRPRKNFSRSGSTSRFMPITTTSSIKPRLKSVPFWNRN